MVTWPQFTIKIIGVHFGNSVVVNNNWDKVNDKLTNKVHPWNKVMLSLRGKNNCQSNPFQNFGNRSNIYNYKVEKRVYNFLWNNKKNMAT